MVQGRGQRQVAITPRWLESMTLAPGSLGPKAQPHHLLAGGHKLFVLQ